MARRPLGSTLYYLLCLFNSFRGSEQSCRFCSINELRWGHTVCKSTSVSSSSVTNHKHTPFFFSPLSSPSISPRSGKLKITPAFKGKISRQGHNEIYLNTCNYCIRFYDDKFQDYSSARTLTRLEATAPPLMQTAHIQLGPLASIFFLIIIICLNLQLCPHF